MRSFAGILSIGLFLFGFLAEKKSSGADTAIVTLSPTTAPGTAEPGVTVVNVTGTGFPTGAINASAVNVSLQPALGAAPLQTAVVSAVTTVFGATRRIVFQIAPGNSVSAPTEYMVSVSGSTSGGAMFASGNAAT